MFNSINGKVFTVSRIHNHTRKTSLTESQSCGIQICRLQKISTYASTPNPHSNPITNPMRPADEQLTYPPIAAPLDEDDAAAIEALLEDEAIPPPPPVDMLGPELIEAPDELAPAVIDAPEADPD